MPSAASEEKARTKLEVELLLNAGQFTSGLKQLTTGNFAGAANSIGTAVGGALGAMTGSALLGPVGALAGAAVGGALDATGISGYASKFGLATMANSDLGGLSNVSQFLRNSQANFGAQGDAGQQAVDMFSEYASSGNKVPIELKELNIQRLNARSKFLAEDRMETKDLIVNMSGKKGASGGILGGLQESIQKTIVDMLGQALRDGLGQFMQGNAHR